MTVAVDADCPRCSATDCAREQVASPTVAERGEREERHDEGSPNRTGRTTETGTLAAFRDGLVDRGRRGT